MVKYLSSDGLKKVFELLKNKFCNRAEFNTHIADNAKHITSDERTKWNSKTKTVFSRTLNSGTKIGTITVDGTATDIFCEKNTNTVYTHPTTSGNKHIPAGGSNGQILRWSADGTAAWGNDSNTTYSNMTAASASAAGKSGLVPAPAAGAQGKYLRGDGTWQTPPDTNTTYGTATQSTNGLMSAADKTKLDGIATGANKYIHPTTTGNKHIPSGGSSGQILRWSADGTAVWGNDNNTTYTVATTDKSGLMSGADKTKLNNTLSITSITQGMIKSLSVTLGTYYIPNISRATKVLVEIWKTGSETSTSNTPKVFTAYVSFYKAGMSNNMIAVNEVNLISASNLTINYKIGSDGRIGINGTISDDVYYRTTWYL